MRAPPIASPAVVKGVAQRVWTDPLGEPGPAGQPAHDPRRSVASQAPAVSSDEDRTPDTLTDREVERPGGPRGQRDGDGLAALAVHQQGPVSSLEAEMLDVGTERLGDPQTVQRQERAQHMILGRRQPGFLSEIPRLRSGRSSSVSSYAQS
jgi:hypothetical protein